MSGKDDVCRAITFINYHIPITPGMECKELEDQYSTVGFFDGMITERLKIDFDAEGLKGLWRYGLKRTAESKGCYSYQNTFCFSRDDWNRCEDAMFWAEKTNEMYPLTFVVFLQLKDYVKRIGRQCVLFDQKVREVIKADEGISYTYATVDKNDFIVCIKCRNYGNAVNAIKKLHETEMQVIYSYTVFSVSKRVLECITEKKYDYLYNENIKSICLKGITNSYDSDKKMTLDRKYHDFCVKLVEKFFDKSMTELRSPQYDFKIYDILGEDDFRLIVRDVKLGRILCQLASGGMLCYSEKKFQYYLFSSGLVLNVETEEKEEVTDYDIKDIYDKMEQDFSAHLCGELQEEMNRIQEVISNYENIEDEKEITCFQAVWQLLQSLKALEMAPVKKYDFWSLYHPLSLLIRILEEKCKIGEKGREVFRGENVYEFIHKISMTFHGTLRTDIQFFQIRDFNVTVHYAPSKLRAFYALWTLEVSRYYNAFCDDENKKEYSFIFSPGMFKRTYVRELIVSYAETKRLMLIATPERELYLPQWLSIIIGHEVSHFVGGTVRNREERHKTWIKVCARILQLELHSMCYKQYPAVYKDEVEKWVSSDSYLKKSIVAQLLEEEERIRNESNLYPYEFHSRNSMEIISCAFRNIQWNYIAKFIAEEGEELKNFIQKERTIERMPRDERNLLLNSIRKLSKGMCDYQMELYSRFQHNALDSILGVLKHITSETFADLMVILTLNLKPKEYVLSFVKSEMDLRNMTETELNKGALLFVRLGITIQSICDIVKVERARLDEEFCKAWDGDVLKKLIVHFPIGSAEFKIAVKTWGYLDECRKMDAGIRKYSTLFDIEKEEFKTTAFDFFRDKEVFSLLCAYLKSCASIYVEKLYGSGDIKKQRTKLLHTYNTIAEGSIIDLIQGIEDFLEEYKGG